MALAPVVVCRYVPESTEERHASAEPERLMLEAAYPDKEAYDVAPNPRPGQYAVFYFKGEGQDGLPTGFDREIIEVAEPEPVAPKVSKLKKLKKS